jgi:uncharacterized protein YabE (DUF348 family)
VSANADTVGELLAAQDITLTGRDVVAPSATAPIEDGDAIVVRYGRPLTVTVDGTPKTYWTTELTVDSALAALGIRAEGARLSASRSQPLGRAGLALSLTTPKAVSLRADGKTRSLRTTAPTVADVLAEQGITVRPLDRLSVAASTPTVKGLTITLTRIAKKTMTAHESLAYATRTVKSATMFTDQRKVVTQGRTGARTAIYSLILADGKVRTKTLVSATVTTAPVTKVVQVGTKTRPVSTGGGGGSVSGADGLNWAALAKCESGGNPRAVNPAGYYGLYQFSLSTWHAMGGSGNPIDNSSAEQTYRAKILYKKAGAGQWPVCGRKLFT